MIEQSLQFPTGQFTHTELAKLNGKTNQQVWTRYQKAIKDGQIIRDGERKTPGAKGKPSLLWKVNPNYVPPAPAPVVAPATPVTVNGASVIITAVLAATAATVEPPVVPSEPVITPAVTPEPAPVASVPVVVVEDEGVVLPTEAEIEAALGPVTSEPVMA